MQGSIHLFDFILQCTMIGIDGSDSINADILEQEQIDGFPTIALYKNGLRLSDYNGDRNDR
jgi:hypothetical protein